ncbi:MAG: zinc ribbon domain-containing protein [Acidimicrobiia bacterium]|nr:zinc ribbon domain-containing protein [Acidimicrobiia bacterium]
MSSATSTKSAPSGSYSTSPAAGAADAEAGLRPWHFFVLAALACATAVTWMARAQGLTVVLLLTVLMGTVALVAIATFRTVRPLVAEEDDRTPMVGERTRAALEREKVLTLRAIKELEFDHAMKKLSEEDFKEMSGRLRGRAARLIRQLDAGTGYRQRIEQDLAKRLGTHDAPREAAARSAGPTCAACATANDVDARFCKSCGARL